MPEDDPQVPVTPEPPQPPVAPGPGQTPPRKSELEELSEFSQRAWQQLRPILKQQSIAILRLTSQALATAANRLETGRPHSALPDGASPRPVGPTPQELLERVRPYWQRFQVFWQQAQGQIRSRLPVDLNRKLSDRALSGVMAGAIVLLLWFTTSLVSGGGSSPKPAPVASVPLAQRPAPADLRAPAELNVPEAVPEPVELSPPPIASPILPEPVAEIPVATPEPEPAPPPPPLELTPEQKLIADIQDQVADVTNRYASGLIQSIQANFQSSRLSVNVGDGWYSLSDSQQDQLARELFGRSQELDFDRLMLKDAQGSLLARNPVVGTDMVILKRH